MAAALIIILTGSDQETMDDARETISAYLHNAIEDYNCTAGGKPIRFSTSWSADFSTPSLGGEIIESFSIQKEEP